MGLDSEGRLYVWTGAAYNDIGPIESATVAQSMVFARDSLFAVWHDRLEDRARHAAYLEALGA
jgi:hypothetical protein